jgi:hypothetical protein
MKKLFLLFLTIILLFSISLLFPDQGGSECIVENVVTFDFQQESSDFSFENAGNFLDIYQYLFTTNEFYSDFNNNKNNKVKTFNISNKVEQQSALVKDFILESKFIL